MGTQIPLLQTVFKPRPRVFNRISNYFNTEVESPQEAYIAQEYIDDEVFQSEENSSESRITVEIEINDEHPDIVKEEKDQRNKQNAS